LLGCDVDAAAAVSYVYLPNHSCFVC